MEENLRKRETGEKGDGAQIRVEGTRLRRKKGREEFRRKREVQDKEKGGAYSYSDKLKTLPGFK